MTTLAAPRRVPPLGGLNTTLLGLELRRLLRNRRTMIITLVMPVVFFLIFGLNPSYSGESAGNGRRDGAGSCGSPPCPPGSTSSSRCSSR